MNLSHEEKLIAMRGFEDAIEKDANALTELGGAALRKLTRAAGKVTNKSKEVASKGKALMAGATGKGVSSAKRSKAGIVAGHTSKDQINIYNKGGKLYENRGKILAGTGIAGTALVMKD